MMEYTKEDLKRDAGIPHLPTDLTYELRMAVTGHKKDEFLSYGYQWTDKPHRLVYVACREIERQAAEIERLRWLLQNWMGCCFVDEKNGSVSFGMGVKKVWSETRSALQQEEGK